MFQTLEPRILFSAGGTGLRAVYFNNANFTGTTVTRVDRRVAFDWQHGSPDPHIAPDTFAARWTGQVQPSFSETYIFKTVSDDGVRLWVNHHLLIDTWNAQRGRATSAHRITLDASRRYEIQLEYREKTGAASCRLLWSSPSTPETVVPPASLFPKSQSLRSQVDHAVAFAQSQLKRDIAELAPDYSSFPSITNDDGTWKELSSADWTAGFWAGCLWQMFTRTGDRAYRLPAQSWTRTLASASSSRDDTGFRFIPTYLPLYRTLKIDSDKQVLFDVAAAKVSAFNSHVGMFKSVNFTPSHSGDARADFPVLMDHSMDIELVYEAARLNGRDDWVSKANSHLRKVAQNMVRADGSTVQWGYFYDVTGEFISGETRQGMSDTSTWSRGQAWAMYSFATAYAETARSEFLNTAKKVIDYYLSHLPADHVPYWDFDAPVAATTPKDSSAAAIAASALFKFASALPSSDPDAARYRAAAEAMIGALASPAYLAEGSSSRGILLHGVKSVPNGVSDNSLIFGDYYFLEALNRYAGLP